MKQRWWTKRCSVDKVEKRRLAPRLILGVFRTETASSSRLLRLRLRLRLLLLFFVVWSTLSQWLVRQSSRFNSGQ